MKNLIQFKLVTSLIIILFACGCNKDNGKNNDGGQPEPIDTTSNTASACSYDSICLDYRLFDTIEKIQLIGQWELEANIDTVDCSVEPKPSDLKGNVIIEFHLNDSISGVTPSNEIWGTYLIKINKISFPDLFKTEAMEYPWGDKFIKALWHTEYFTIANNLLIIHSKNTILIFHKIDTEL